MDSVWAVGAGAAALAVYVRTLVPGLVGDVDAPMFQFIGRVLGVAHNPGYPLYVLLTYPVALLPFGSLAYRINLFSALLGALTVSLAFVVARQLGCRRIVSLAAALGLAFGQVFWSQAQIAEVYTLNSAIVAGMLACLLAWRQTHRAGYFFAAVALLAAGLGNHTTIVGFVPGMLIFAVLTDRLFVLRPRTIAVSIAILCVGLLQYGLILLRSSQTGTYVESPAKTIPHLVDVILGRQFRDRLFVFDWHAVVLDRLPTLVERMLTPELTLAGLLLAAVGAVWLLRRQLAEAVLLLAYGGAIVAFAVNYSVIDTPVFLVPAILVLWLLAAAGTEWIARVAGRRRAVGTAIGLAALILPAWLVTHNFAVNDRSRDIEADVHLNRLFTALPDRSALIHEDFIIDRMVMFELLGDRAAGTRRIEPVTRDPGAVQKKVEDRFNVFGFGKSVRLLRYDGLTFAYRPLPLIEGPLAGFLSRQADGAIVAIAVPAAHAQKFTESGASFEAIGGPSDIAVRTPSNVAIVGVRGARQEGTVQIGADVHLVIGANQLIGQTGSVSPSAIEIRSEGSEIAIRQGSRDIVRTSEGAAMAVWNPNGRLSQTFVLQAKNDFGVPIPLGPLSVYPLRRTSRLDLPAQQFTDIRAPLETGSAMVRVPTGQSVIMYVSDDARLEPRVVSSLARGRFTATSFDDTEVPALRARLAQDQVPASGVEPGPGRHVYRIEIDASEGTPTSVLLALGGIPSHAIGRAAHRGSSAPVTLFRVDTDGLLRTPDDASDVLRLARDDQAQLTGYGWSPVDSDAVSAYRWMIDTESRLLLPIEKKDVRRIGMQALHEEAGGPTTVRLRLNDTDLPAQPLQAGWHAYEWTVPPGSIRQGTNEVAIIVDRLSLPSKARPAARGLAVTEVRTSLLPLP